MVNIRIECAGGKRIPTAKALPVTLQVDPSETIGDVKKSIQNHFPRFKAARQRLTTEGKKALEDDQKVGDVSETTYYIKDLGPQLSWRTVFIIEYFGPLWIIPLYYYFPQVYGLVGAKTNFVHSDMQRLVLVLVLIHYLKREFETIFIHRFSKATMPAMYAVRNSGHYWGLSGVILGAGVFGPWYSQSALAGTIRADPAFLQILTAIWGFGELSNLWTHLTLRSLRPAGTRTRQIPYGYGFNLVSCPNYTFEIISWLAILGMTWDPAVAIFLVVGTVTMTIWAIGKHRRYKKEFGAAYPKRKVIFPFVF